MFFHLCDEMKGLPGTSVHLKNKEDALGGRCSLGEGAGREDDRCDNIMQWEGWGARRGASASGGSSGT